VRRIVAEALKVPPERLHPTSALDQFGIDSILAIDLTERLEAEVGPLPRTLFYDCKTLEQVAESLRRTHPQAFADAVPAAMASPEAPPSAAITPKAAPVLAAERIDFAVDFAVLAERFLAGDVEL